MIGTSFEEVTHSGAGQVRHLAPAARADGARRAIRRGAPVLGEHAGEILGGRLPARTRSAAIHDARRPLEGIRVADLSWAWAGPFCGMNLAHLGAEVVRIESAARPDLYRRLPIHPRDVERTLDTAGMSNQWNQGKKSISLNLAEPRAKELLADYIATCDVVVENFATGVMDRLGLGYEALAERNSRTHPREHFRLRTDGALRSIHGLRTRHRTAHRARHGHRICRRRPLRDRGFHARSKRRHHLRLRDLRRARKASRDGARLSSRYLPLGRRQRSSRHRGMDGLCDERRGAHPPGQSRPLGCLPTDSFPRVARTDGSGLRVDRTKTGAFCVARSRPSWRRTAASAAFRCASSTRTPSSPSSRPEPEPEIAGN